MTAIVTQCPSASGACPFSGDQPSGRPAPAWTSAARHWITVAKPAYRPSRFAARFPPSLEIVQAVAGRPEGWAPIKGHAPDAPGHWATIAGIAVRGERRVMPVHPLRRMAANLGLACGNCGNCGNLL